MSPRAALIAAAGVCACGGSTEPLPAPLEAGIDLLALGDDGLRRVYGSTGDGSLGLPVAGGHDVDGDGLLDTAFGAMQSSPGAPGAGSVFVVFGDGAVYGAIDTATPRPDVLRIDGRLPYEYTGSELWIDDVTGDGIGDVLIGRQNHTPDAGAPGERRAAGALSIVVGGPALRAQAQALSPLALDEPGPDLSVVTLAGAEAGSRLGIWMRSGDVTGDGIADLAVGADQEGGTGAVYLVAGGPHLAVSATLDLAAPAALEGQLARIVPPPSPEPRGYHFGATCQLADLDGNGRAELLAAAALDRAGAALDADGTLNAEGSGGAPRGSVYIAWDDNFPALPWPPAFGFAIGAGAGTFATLRGGPGNAAFGEELIGGLDWDADGSPDLFVGDLTANLVGRPDSGSSHIIYGAARLRGIDASISELEMLSPPIPTTTIVGAGTADISGDTAAQGDFTGDGTADLVVCSPHANPLRRHSAGSLHVLAGRAGGWPRFIDLSAPPGRPELDMWALFGAHGSFGFDRGDTLCYSAASGDVDGDGRADLITNEMVGNGLNPSAVNVGNLLILSAALAGMADGSPAP